MIRLLWALSVRTSCGVVCPPISCSTVSTRRELLHQPHRGGAPGWLRLLVPLFIWNAMKLIVLGPVSRILLVCVRIQEAVARHLARRQGKTL